MQTFGLPGHVTSGAALASRLCGAEYSEAARRRDAFRHWRGAPNGCPPWSRRSSGCARTIRCGARPCAARRVTPDACPRAASPGEVVPLDTLSLQPGRPAWFTAHDPVAKWTCAQAWRRTTARQTLPRQAPMPFPIEAIQVDGGSEFKADFDARAAASRCSHPARPGSTDTSGATTAPGDTSSAPRGTCPTTASTTSTDRHPRPSALR